MSEELAAAMLADAQARIERLALVVPDIAQRQIPALDNRTISEALEAGDMWELINRTLNRHEEVLHGEIVGFGALLVEGLEADRFVLFEHAVLGDRTSAPMPVGAFVRVTDSQSGLVLGHGDAGAPAIWRVEAGPGQEVVMGGFGAGRGDRVRLRVTSGDHELGLNDLINPTGSPARPAVLSKIAAIRASMERHGVAKRRRVAFGGEPGQPVPTRSSAPQAGPALASMPSPRAQAPEPKFQSSLQATTDAASPGLVYDLTERMPVQSGIAVSSRWLAQSFFVDISIPGAAGEASWLGSVEFLYATVILESVFPTPAALAKDLDSSPVAAAMGDGHLCVLGSTELQQQVLEATTMLSRISPDMLTLNHYALHFADAQWAIQVLANTAQMHWAPRPGGDGYGS